MALSEAIIVAVIGGVAVVAAAAVPVLISKRKKTLSSHAVNDRQEPPPPARVLPPSIAKSPPSQSREGLPVSAFSIKEMQERISSVPPFQRAAVEHHYVGLRVQWRAKLGSISSDKKTSSVYAHADDGYMELSCRSTPADIITLIHTPQDAPILVDGILASVSTAYCQLVDCVVTADDPNNVLIERILKQSVIANSDSPLMQITMTDAICDGDVASTLQNLIDDGMIKGAVLSTTPLTFYITQLTAKGRAHIQKHMSKSS